MNPVAAISHVIAIALGIFGGVWAVNALSPELPDSGVEPGVEIPVQVEPESPESLFNPGPLSTAGERKEISQEVVRQMDLAATKGGLIWVVHIDSSVPRPTRYLVPYGTDEIEANGPLPDALLP